MPKRLKRPDVKIGDIVESRKGHQRRYLGTFGDDQFRYVIWEAIKPRRRREAWLRPPAPVVDPVVRPFCGHMEPAGWARWIAGGRVVEDGDSA